MAWYDNWSGSDWGNLASGVASGATAAYGIWSAADAADNQSDYNNAAIAGLNSNTAIAAEQAAMAREEWDRYQEIYDELERARVNEELGDMELYRPLKEAVVGQQERNISLYQPVENKFIDNAMSGIDEQEWKSRASADVSAAFDRNRDITMRNAKRSGSYNPNSGASQALEHSLGLSRTLADAGAQTKAMTDARDYNQTQLGNALNVRKGLPALNQSSAGSTTAGLTAAMSGLSGASNTLANTASGYSNLAGTAANQKSDAMGMVGTGLGLGLGTIQNAQNQNNFNALLSKLK